MSAHSVPGSSHRRDQDHIDNSSNGSDGRHLAKTLPEMMQIKWAGVAAKRDSGGRQNIHSRPGSTGPFPVQVIIYGRKKAALPVTSKWKPTHMRFTVEVGVMDAKEASKIMHVYGITPGSSERAATLDLENMVPPSANPYFGVRMLREHGSEFDHFQKQVQPLLGAWSIEPGEWTPEKGQVGMDLKSILLLRSMFEFVAYNRCMTYFLVPSILSGYIDPKDPVIRARVGARQPSNFKVFRIRPVGQDNVGGGRTLYAKQDNQQMVLLMYYKIPSPDKRTWRWRAGKWVFPKAPDDERSSAQDVTVLNEEHRLQRPQELVHNGHVKCHREKRMDDKNKPPRRKVKGGEADNSGRNHSMHLGRDKIFQPTTLEGWSQFKERRPSSPSGLLDSSGLLNLPRAFSLASPRLRDLEDGVRGRNAAPPLLRDPSSFDHDSTPPYPRQTDQQSAKGGLLSQSSLPDPLPRNFSSREHLMSMALEDSDQSDQQSAPDTVSVPRNPPSDVRALHMRTQPPVSREAPSRQGKSFLLRDRDSLNHRPEISDLTIARNAAAASSLPLPQ
eukprot:834058-Rhodomonas_salina.1